MVDAANLTRAQVARIIDYTLLKPEATVADVEAHLADARRLGVSHVCISPSMLPVAADDLVLGVVAGFPSGKHHSLIKGSEARLAVQLGAQEIDMVIDVGAALAGEYDVVRTDILTVHEGIGDYTVLKVILETALLNDEQIRQCCIVAEEAGAQFVKTSTGFHPAGGASVHAVEVMRAAVGDHIGVKASGGIRDAGFARELIAAGATRLGLSATEAVLAGFPE